MLLYNERYSVSRVSVGNSTPVEHLCASAPRSVKQRAKSSSTPTDRRPRRKQLVRVNELAGERAGESEPAIMTNSLCAMLRCSARVQRDGSERNIQQGTVCQGASSRAGRLEKVNGFEFNISVFFFFPFLSAPSSISRIMH